MARTAQTLIRELANRLGEYLFLTASADGLATKIVSQDLVKYFPEDIPQHNAWVYPMSGVADNLGLEARAASWAVGTRSLTLHFPGLTGETRLGDTFEMHLRSQRNRKLEALNEAIGMLGLGCYRPVTDESLTSEAGKYRYTLPSTTPWSTINSLEVLSSSDSDLPPDVLFDWRTEEATNGAGTKTTIIQLGGAIPAGRTLRVRGLAYFTDLASDADVLPLSGKWERIALEWIYGWAACKIMEWTGFREPAGQAARYDAKYQSGLRDQIDDLVRNMMVVPSGRIIVPFSGTANNDGFLDVLRIEP